MELSGNLNITATSNNPFVINLGSLDTQNNPGLAANFDAQQDQNWTMVTAAGGITGFDPNHFVVISSGFENDLMDGSFSVAQLSPNSISLQFTAIPEPSSLALIAVTAILLNGSRFRRHRLTRQ